jgi:hypothetical protein
MAFQYRRPTQEAVDRYANQQGGSFDGFLRDEYRTFTPKNGEIAIRILPRDAKEEADSWFEDILVHYRIGPAKTDVLCPAMAGGNCPICEEKARLDRRGDEEGAKEIRSVRRRLCWIIDRKNEEAGPLLWAMPFTVARDIMKSAKDLETGRYYYVDDPSEGYDVYFTRSGNPPQIDYGPYQLSRRPNSVDSKHLDFVEKNPLMDTLRVRDYDELKRIFSGADATEERSTQGNTSQTQAQPAQEERRPLPPPADDAQRGAPPFDGAERRPPPPDSEVVRQAVEQAEERMVPREAPPRQPDPPASPTVVPISGADRAAALRAKFAARK